MRLAVVLFNLGGPDSPDSVRPFLRNLFNDPAIIAAPGPVRRILAHWLAARRTPAAQEIYRQLNGASPLLKETQAQAAALTQQLAPEGPVRIFVAMRYWHPLVEDTARDVAAWRPDRVVLLPLYPQFSTTTTGSSLAAWRRAAGAAGLTAPTTAVGCYYDDADFIAAHADAIRRALTAGPANPRLLLSAHGVPKRVVARGDPYQWQVERTADRIAAALSPETPEWRACYQSRVGPLEWIGPATEDEIARAGAERRALVVAPIAFVSEHSETLVELDIEYRRLATRCGVPHYIRVPALGTCPRFITALTRQVRRALDAPSAVNTSIPVSNTTGQRRCPASFTTCPCHT